MKKNSILKSLVITAALAAGIAASAQTPADSAPSLTSDGQGLLGQTYAGLTYSYINFDSSSIHADNYGFQYNQALSSGLDGRLAYNYAQSGLVGGSRLKQHDVGAALRAFSNSFTWGKPFVEAGAGYVWQKYGNLKDDSFFWQSTVGIEFQVAPAFTVTPTVQYVDAVDLSGGDTWNYGVSANYWVNSEWSVTVGAHRDDDKNMTYTVGTNFRF